MIPSSLPSYVALLISVAIAFLPLKAIFDAPVVCSLSNSFATVRVRASSFIAKKKKKYYFILFYFFIFGCKKKTPQFGAWKISFS